MGQAASEASLAPIQRYPDQIEDSLARQLRGRKLPMVTTKVPAKAKAQTKVRAFANRIRFDLFVLFGLLLGRGKALKALQEFLPGHALDGDPVAAGVHACTRRSDQWHGIRF